MEHFRELADFGWVGFGEVVEFADVVFQVVELEAPVFEVFDQFPVAGADGAAGEAALVAVVGVVPVDGWAFLFAALFEEGGEAEAVEVLPGLGREAGHFEDGGVEVGRVNNTQCRPCGYLCYSRRCR